MLSGAVDLSTTGYQSPCKPFDLSHEGAMIVLKRLMSYSASVESVPAAVMQVLEVARGRMMTMPPSPPEPRSWNFSDKDMKQYGEDHRKQAARECANLAVDVLCKGTPPSNPAQTVYDAITKAFGL